MPTVTIMTSANVLRSLLLCCAVLWQHVDLQLWEQKAVTRSHDRESYKSAHDQCRSVLASAGQRRATLALFTTANRQSPSELGAWTPLANALGSLRWLKRVIQFSTFFLVLTKTETGKACKTTKTLLKAALRPHKHCHNHWSTWSKWKHGQLTSAQTSMPCKVVFDFSRRLGFPSAVMVILHRPLSLALSFIMFIQSLCTRTVIVWVQL